MKRKLGFKRWTLAVVVLLAFGWYGVILAADSTLFAPAPGSKPTVSQQQAPVITRESLLVETNKYREKPLELDLTLNDSAQRKCNDMSARGDFSHGNWKDYVPSDRGHLGENLARGYSSAKEVLDGWAASPGHQQNLVRSEYNRVGFGICTHDEEVWVVQHFSD